MNKGNALSSKGCVLVVDDEYVSLRVLTAVLEGDGYRVVSAACGEKALQLIAANPPELILLDIVMAGIDGFEVCRRLKGLKQCCHIPVIFLSATTETEERVQGFKLGAVDFVAKPFQKEELLARVQAHLALTRLQAEQKHQASELRKANIRLRSEITMRKAMSASLIESEEKFRTIAGFANDAFIMLDEGDRIVFWNRAAAEVFGYTHAEIAEVNFHERLRPERFWKESKTAFPHSVPEKTGRAASRVIELVLRKHDGVEFTAETSVAAVTLRDKSMRIVVIRDLTARLQAQEKLQRSEERMNLALDAAQMGTWDLDLKTGALWRSPHHDRIFGFPEPVAHWDLDTFLRLLVPGDRQRYLDEAPTFLTAGKIHSEYRIVRESDRMERWISIEGRVYPDEKGVPSRMMGVIVDVTDARLAEETRQATEVQSSLAQKLESVGRLASGVAHEINTPMQFITDNTQFLKGAMVSFADMLGAYRSAAETIRTGKRLDESPRPLPNEEEEKELDYLLGEIPRTFDETMSGIQRVTQIITSLKEFSHPQKNAKQLANLNKAILTTITVSRHEWKYVAELVTELDPNLPGIALRIDEMNQVMLNLIVNAAHAIADASKHRENARGVITVRTRSEADHIVIDVADTGTGIPLAAQSHIFEPFFTTKGVGKGTGQGLSIVRTIVVKNHGGTIHFTTEWGKGTTFHVRIPIIDSDSKRAREEL